MPNATVCASAHGSRAPLARPRRPARSARSRSPAPRPAAACARRRSSRARAARAAPCGCRSARRRRRSGRRSRRAPASRAVRRSRRPIVFLPSIRYGSLSVDDVEDRPVGRAISVARSAAPASPISPSTRYSSAPAATHSRRVIAGAPRGIATRRRMPARAAYVAHAAPALPLVGIAMCRTPSSSARETPTAAPRALNDPVGSSPSSLTSSPGRPIRAPVAGHGQQRRPALAERRRRAAGSRDRQQLAVAPQVGRAAGDLAPDPTARAYGVEVVPGQQRRAALAQVRRPVRVVPGAAARALQVGEGHPAHARARPAA